MELINAIINQRGLIRVEHHKHGSRAFLWLQPEIERFLGFRGEQNKAAENAVRPYCCVICDQLCAMPSLSGCNEKREMGAEWTTHRQSHVEMSGVVICDNCRSGHPKLRIDSYKVSVGSEGLCNCTWSGAAVVNCQMCKAKNRTLMSSRALWESLRVIKPLGLFKDGIMSKFSRHPYLGLREHERNAWLDARFPMLPWDKEEIRERVLQEREEHVRDIKRRDREKDLTLTDIESAKWNFTLWHEPILRCFPETDLKQGSRGKVAWVYVKIDERWQVRSWANLAIELAQGGGWLDTSFYDKDYRGSQPRSNITKEKRPSSRKEKFVQLTVSLANDLDKHKVLCPEDGTYVTGIPYNNEQITEEPSEMFTVVMHFKLNILACSHPDYDWIGGIETELHEKQPKVKVVRRGVLRKVRRLMVEPQN
ncbi:uncharacterized protein LOC131532399 [Onychostoma macrolepis]|uniref:uncharacterized protein LOC131532399 n=1 Tax=Onychostoma macrolepis TaxID=369639 RepID=UPI00272DBF20|nr:uncharacterized protein LOC131532399 [Onychostoma macrolepis]